jgi:TolA-binding protein
MKFFSTTFALPTLRIRNLVFAGLIALAHQAASQTTPDSLARPSTSSGTPSTNSGTPARLAFTEQDIAQAISENETLLKKYPNQDFSPLVMFQLGELYVRRSAIAYQKSMTAYDAALKRYEAGKEKTEPQVPRIDFSEAISLSDQILAKFPTAQFLDKVLYRLALCHSESGNGEMARIYLERLVEEYPRSAYLLESYFRLGENYFDNREYDRAIAAYSKLFNKWDNPYFNMALYKLGWAYYNTNDYAKAISTFIYVIDDINRVSSVKDATALGATKIDLRKESIEYISQSFAEFGGARKAEKFLIETLDALPPATPVANGKPTEREYLVDIFLKLADTYRDRNAYDESSATLETLLRRWPLHLQAPQLQNRIVENHLQAGNPEKAEAARVTLVENYGPGSAWLAHYFKNENIPGAIEARIAALTLTDEMLYTLATEAQTRAQKSGDENEYKLAISRYGEYLEKFPNSPAAAKTQYYLADCYYEIKAFADAADAYHKVVVNHPASEFAGESAYNRVIANLEEVDQATTVDSMTYQLADFLGTGITQILRLPNKSYARLLNACSDYSKTPAVTGAASHSMKTSEAGSLAHLADRQLEKRQEKLPEVMMKYGETLYKVGQFELSRQVYLKVATELPPNQYSLSALTMVANSSFQEENYQVSEKWYRKIISDFPDSTRHVERANKMIASGSYKVAETMKSAGADSAAAQAFVALAGSSKDDEISKRSLLEAAALFEKKNDKAYAMSVYEQFYSKFPTAEGAELSLLKAGELAEDQANWPHAVQNYLTLANDFPVSQHAARAVFQAGQCYENARDTVNAITTYRRYTQTYKEDAAQLLDVMGKLGELYYHQGQFAEAKKSLEETIAAYRKFIKQEEAVDEYIPAQAQFLLAEMRFQDYCKLELKPPFERNFKKKKTLFNEVLTAYREASDYQVADWATAATHKIGESFEEFARAFSAAPRPEGLSEADLAAYEESLLQKVRPFKERALETYRANLKMAEENSVQNDWVARSHQRAEALAAELGVAANGDLGHSSSNGTVEQSTN